MVEEESPLPHNFTAYVSQDTEGEIIPKETPVNRKKKEFIDVAPYFVMKQSEVKILPKD